jgi:integrase
MGRKPGKPGAIPHFRVRKQKSGVVHYYYDHGGKPRREEPLGSDYGLAIKRWAEIQRASAPPAASALTFRQVSERYMAEVAALKAPRTLDDNRKERAKLLEFFDDPPGPFEAIEPVNVRQYLTWRTRSGKGHVRANREKALLSHIWNFARDKGYTALPNPCAGIKGFKEDGRDVYIEDDQFAAVWRHADRTVRDAMDLAYLLGQRPADVLGLTEMDVRDGFVHVQQGKTKKGATRGKLRVEVSPELQALLDRIAERKRGHTVHNTRLIVNDHGRSMSVAAMSRRWKKACEAANVTGLQFRDLRAKAGTDKADSAGDIRQAQRQLGHTSVVMTEHYTRKRRGQKVTPTR